MNIYAHLNKQVNDFEMGKNSPEEDEMKVRTRERKMSFFGDFFSNGLPYGSGVSSRFLRVFESDYLGVRSTFKKPVDDLLLEALFGVNLTRFFFCLPWSGGLEFLA